MGPCSTHSLVQSYILRSQCILRTLEAPLEHVARTRPVTEGVRHLEDYVETRVSRLAGT